MPLKYRLIFVIGLIINEVFLVLFTSDGVETTFQMKRIKPVKSFELTQIIT